MSLLSDDNVHHGAVPNLGVHITLDVLMDVHLDCVTKMKHKCLRMLKLLPVVKVQSSYLLATLYTTTRAFNSSPDTMSAVQSKSIQVTHQELQVICE